MKTLIENISGIDCVFTPMNDINSVTVEVLCKAWSIYENRENNGISHFLEHLFFKWWKKYTNPKAVAEAVDKFGWEFNAYTGEEYAGYYVKCAPEFIYQAIDVLWDMMMNAQFPADELEREKWVVIQELKMYEDNPMALVMEKWQKYYFWDNSYGWPTIWTEENINSFSQDDLFLHKKNLYTKDNVVINIAGKIENLDEIKKILWDIFGTLPENRLLDKPKFEKILPNEKIWIWTKWTEQNHLVISAPGFDGNDERRYAANVLATILGWNMSSRLFQNIREKQWLCYYIRASHMTSQDYGVFMIRSGIDKTRFEGWVEKIFEEIKKIANGEFSEEEFKNAIWYSVGQLQMWIESSDEMASFIWSQYLIYKEIETLEEMVKKYENLTIDEIKDIAKYLSDENLYMYYIC
mgnify:CR=1 FL=1